MPRLTHGTCTAVAFFLLDHVESSAMSATGTCVVFTCWYLAVVLDVFVAAAAYVPFIV